MKVYGELVQPDGLTTLTAETQGQIYVKNPCVDTILDTLTIEDMQMSVLTDPIIQSFDPVQDSESKVNGNKSGLGYCGPRKYSIMTKQMEIIQFDPDKRQIIVNATDNLQIGIYQVILRAELEFDDRIYSES